MRRPTVRFFHPLGAISCALAILAVCGPSLDAALISDFTVYARNDVFIGVGSTVTGLVGAGSSVVGDDGDTSLNGQAEVFGDIRSSADVSLGNGTRVTGTITNPGNFTLGSGVTFGAHITAMPDLPSLPPATVFSHGVTNQSVGNGGTLNLAPGDWNNVTLGGAATLKLIAGTYRVNRLMAGNGLTLDVDLTQGVGGLLKLFVTDDFSAGGISSMSVIGGSEANIFVETHHVGTNAFRIGGGNGTNWKGQMFTPNGDIHVGSGSSSGVLFGHFWAGRHVDIEHGIDLAPGFTPIPEPSSLVLAASGVLLIGITIWRRKQISASGQTAL